MAPLTTATWCGARSNLSNLAESLEHEEDAPSCLHKKKKKKTCLPAIPGVLALMIDHNEHYSLAGHTLGKKPKAWRVHCLPFHQPAGRKSKSVRWQRGWLEKHITPWWSKHAEEVMFGVSLSLGKKNGQPKQNTNSIIIIIIIIYIR